MSSVTEVVWECIFIIHCKSLVVGCSQSLRERVARALVQLESSLKMDDMSIADACCQTQYVQTERSQTSRTSSYGLILLVVCFSGHFRARTHRFRDIGSGLFFLTVDSRIGELWGIPSRLRDVTWIACRCSLSARVIRRNGRIIDRRRLCHIDMPAQSICDKQKRKSTLLPPPKWPNAAFDSMRRGGANP